MGHLIEPQLEAGTELESASSEKASFETLKIWKERRRRRRRRRRRKKKEKEKEKKEKKRKEKKRKEKKRKEKKKRRKEEKKKRRKEEKKKRRYAMQEHSNLIFRIIHEAKHVKLCPTKIIYGHIWLF